MGISSYERQSTREHPLCQLPEEDLDFVLQFVLSSGSLKEMARLYSVSYPTIRTTLDHVITNLQQRVDGAPPDPMTNLLADLVERGELKIGNAKMIRSVYRNALEAITDKEKPQ
ncbi:DUF2089 domain-containing protein [Acidicapsa ligni]|uniref:DUF2089 domain-containing protein n=1 Tax=Acidicapsa ligni TaxID=542300 RepID=UPI0021E04035|nr:DUF2089 domain-containing protein [Acidicapsa ligni]